MFVDRFFLLKLEMIIKSGKNFKMNDEVVNCQKFCYLLGGKKKLNKFRGKNVMKKEIYLCMDYRVNIFI